MSVVEEYETGYIGLSANSRYDNGLTRWRLESILVVDQSSLDSSWANLWTSNHFLLIWILMLYCMPHHLYIFSYSMIFNWEYRSQAEIYWFPITLVSSFPDSYHPFFCTSLVPWIGVDLWVSMFKFLINALSKCYSNSSSYSREQRSPMTKI